MRSFRTSFVAVALISSVVLATSHSANSGEKQRCRIITTCSQPTPDACASSASQPATLTQTCCQPATATVQPRIELVAYTRPASPRRLAPQPDALDIRRTTSDTACAWFMAMDYGTYQIYYGTRCSDGYPLPIYGNNLAPLPGDCGSPGGACVTLGSSVIPTAFNKKSSSNDSAIQKSVRLSQKRKAGEEPRDQVDAQAMGAHKLKERTRVGQPNYIKFARPEGESGFVVVELQRYFVKGTGKPSQELSGTFALGLEIDAVPEGKAAKEIDRRQIQVVADHVAKLEIGDVTYEIVTASKLVP